MLCRTMGNHCQNCSDRSDRCFLDQPIGEASRLPQHVQVVRVWLGSGRIVPMTAGEMLSIRVFPVARQVTCDAGLMRFLV
jgi:hypothetical protein